MGPLFRTLALVAACAAALAQVPTPKAPTAAPEAPAPVDALGRQTPRGAVIGFLQSAQALHYQEAARYLQLPAAQVETVGPKLARELKLLMDQGFSANFDAISNRPEGSLDDRLPTNQERVGVLNATGQLPLLLVRVNDAEAGPIWLFSAETLRAVPEFYREIGMPVVESWLPDWIVQRNLFGVSAWKWIAALALFPILAGISWLLVQLISIPGRIVQRLRGHAPLLDTWRTTAKSPVVLLVTVILHRIAMSQIGIPVLYRYYYGLVIWLLILAVLSWLAWRLLDRGSRAALRYFSSDHPQVTASLVLLGRRFAKVLVVVLAVTTALSAMGFEMRTVIAGLGIGGIAVALAAQKTIENVFGGLSLLGDRVVQIGDVLQIGDRVGTVEDIGLRSTRLRTVERTELSIPNGQLSTVNIENLSRRDKFLFNPALILRSDTTNDQLLYALAELRKLLYQHPKVERESARVRLAAITEAGFRIEFFTYLLTRDFNESTGAREDILFRILDILETSGARLASGERILTSDPHENQPSQSPATAQVKAWSTAGDLPFPDYRPEDIERMRGTLPYPRPDSALNRDGKS